MPQRQVKGPDGIVHVFPVDATDQEISAALEAPPATARGAARERSWADMAVDALPTLGGLAGGIVGGIGGTVAGMGVGGVPGAVGGAALGGGAGEAARQMINRARGEAAPTSATEAATAIGTQGATQAGSELAGRGIVKAAGMAARGLMDFAIRPAPTVAEEFGDIAATAIKERLPVGSVLPGATKGSARAKSAMRESGADTRRLLTDAEKAGTSFRPQDVARGPVTELAGDIAKQPLSTSELQQVSRMFAEFLDTQPGRVAPNAMKDMKQAAQRIAKPIFRALNQGNSVAAGESLKAQFNKAIADGAKEALETIPGVGASEARTQGLIGATRAIRRAESRRLPLVAELAAPIVGGVAGGASDGGSLGGVGQGVSVALLTRALLSPRTTSRAALGLTDPAIQQVMRQMPRASVYALLERLEKERENQNNEQSEAQ